MTKKAAAPFTVVSNIRAQYRRHGWGRPIVHLSDEATCSGSDIAWAGSMPGWRQPQCKQISAFALIAAPHSKQNFSSNALDTVIMADIAAPD
jgi:hypothetical protein